MSRAAIALLLALATYIALKGLMAAPAAAADIQQWACEPYRWFLANVAAAR